MLMKELRFEARNVFQAAAPDLNNIHSAEQRLQQLTEALESAADDGADATELAACKIALAQKALELEQILLPRCHALADKAMSSAGAAAIRQACKGISRGGQTGHDGLPLADIPSPYTCPEKFRHVGTKAADALKAVGSVAVAIAAALAR